MNQAAVERDRVVGPPVRWNLKLQMRVSSATGGGRLPGWFRIARGAGKAAIEAGPEAIEDTLGLRCSAGVLESEFGDEAVLEGAEEPFDPAFGLWGRGGDPGDAEFAQGAADLGVGDIACELVGDGETAGVVGKHAVAIGVDGRGDAVALNETAEKQQVAVAVFMRPKDAIEDFAGGIIDGGLEDELRAAGFQPAMGAAVHLDEQAGLGHAVAAAPMAWGPAVARGAEAGLPEPALKRRT